MLNDHQCELIKDQLNNLYLTKSPSNEFLFKVDEVCKVLAQLIDKFEALNKRFTNILEVNL